MADAATHGEEEDKGITMVDVLAEEEEREMDAAAVLGAADDTSCTYDQGPVKRQALYACMTCCPPDSGRMAGFCLACCYHCHEGHDLVELYTKRHFRCDCGNSKFPQNPCKLLKDKESENPDNQYNHNFLGTYCTCQRPYPDPEDKVEDEMIQCCMCEDWYHGRHQGGKVPPGDDYAEMVCSLCLAKNDFLAYYLGSCVTVGSKEEVKGGVDVEGGSDNCNKESSTPPKEAEKTQDQTKENEKSKSECKVKGGRRLDLPAGAAFFPDNWRKHLCTCPDCKAQYATRGVGFLLDEDDTVQAYEERGKSSQRSKGATAQRELEALSSLDRVTRTEMVHEYNTLSSSLRDYLRKFAENGKQVREEDIKEFFQQLTATKKQRAGSSIQLFCK